MNSYINNDLSSDDVDGDDDGNASIDDNDSNHNGAISNGGVPIPIEGFVKTHRRRCSTTT